MPPLPPGGSRRARPGPSRRSTVVVVVVVLVVAGLAGLGLLLSTATTATTASTASTAPVPVVHRTAVQRDGVDTARLDLVTGGDTISVVGAAPGGDLVEASTPEGARTVPALSRPEPGRVVVSTADGAPADPGVPADLTVRLAPDVDWAVALNGGAKLVSLDLSAVRLGSVDITQGVQDVDARLPRPTGTLVTRISGGASSVRLHVPAGVPVRVTFDAGAGSATLDDDRRGGVGNGTVLTSANWSDPSPGRVDVQLDSGVGSVVVDRTP